MAPTPARRRKLRYRLTGSASLVLAMLVGLIGFAPAAYGWHPVLKGTATCQQDGKFSIDWTVGNSQTALPEYMLVRDFSVTPSVGTTSGLVQNPGYTGIVSVGNPAGATIVAPGGSVTATTADIPAGTTDVTLSVTGYWRAPGQRAESKVERYTVDLSRACSGSLRITKSVRGQSAPADASYTVTYTNGRGTSGRVLIKAGETKTVSGLPFGSYTLAEVGNPPNDVATISPNPASVDARSPQARIEVTNSFPDLGSFKVTKRVTGETTGYVRDSTFTVHYDCGSAGSGDFTVRNGETKQVSGLAVGTTCSLSERAKPATTNASYSYGTESWSPSSSVTIVAGDREDVTRVTLTNPIVRTNGGFAVTKRVTGESAGYVPGSTFTVHYACSNEVSGDLVLTNGQVKTVGGLPIGTTCTLSETAKPATLDASYVYAQEYWLPSPSVTVVANEENNMQAVRLVNRIRRIDGGLTVTKRVTGETAGYVPGSTFTVHYDCGVEGSGDLKLVDGEKKIVTGLPIGTRCTLSETAKPSTTGARFAYGTETWNPSNVVTIPVNSDENSVDVFLSNPIVKVVGGFDVTKRVTGETAGYVPGSTFTVHYDCGAEGSGDLKLVDGQTASVRNLPIGTSCALSETVTPPTKDASYRYGSRSWSPSDHITIDRGGQVVSVRLENSIRRILGSFSVTKRVTGETAGYVGGSTFTVTYVCSNGTGGSLSLTRDQTGTVRDLPLGTTCTLAETTKAATLDGSYAFGPEIWSPSSTVTITSEEGAAAVTLTNPIRRLLGGFSVTKHVTGETAGYMAGSKFTVSYDCGSALKGTLQMMDGETQGVGSLPVGTTCRLSETAKPTTTDASYGYATESWTPSSTVTVTDEGKVVALVLDNPIQRVLGGFSVTKKVTGETAGYVAGSTFTVSYTCADGTTGSLTLGDGRTASVSKIPVGTTCTLAETSKPATTGNAYAWDTETWSPSNKVVIATGQPAVVAVTLTNPIKSTVQVLATTLTAPSVQAATLPRTGSSSTLWLVTFAGLLILGGGFLVLASRSES